MPAISSGASNESTGRVSFSCATCAAAIAMMPHINHAIGTKPRPQSRHLDLRFAPEAEILRPAIDTFSPAWLDSNQSASSLERDLNLNLMVSERRPKMHPLLPTGINKLVIRGL